MTMVAVQNVNEHASHLATVCINQISIMNALQSARLTLKHMNMHTHMQSAGGGGGGGGREEQGEREECIMYCWEVEINENCKCLYA